MYRNEKKQSNLLLTTWKIYSPLRLSSRAGSVTLLPAYKHGLFSPLQTYSTVEPSTHSSCPSCEKQDTHRANIRTELQPRQLLPGFSKIISRYSRHWIGQSLLFAKEERQNLLIQEEISFKTDECCYSFSSVGLWTCPCWTSKGSCPPNSPACTGLAEWQHRLLVCVTPKHRPALYP